MIATFVAGVTTDKSLMRADFARSGRETLGASLLRFVTLNGFFVCQFGKAEQIHSQRLEPLRQVQPAIRLLKPLRCAFGRACGKHLAKANRHPCCPVLLKENIQPLTFSTVAVFFLLLIYSLNGQEISQCLGGWRGFIPSAFCFMLALSTLVYDF